MVDSNYFFDLIDNPSLFYDVYGENVVNILDRISLLGYSIDRFSRDIYIGFDMLNYPINPPPQWEEGNMIYLNIGFKNIKDISMKISNDFNISYINNNYEYIRSDRYLCNLSLHKKDEFIVTNIKGENIFINIISSNVFINKINSWLMGKNM